MKLSGPPMFLLTLTLVNASQAKLLVHIPFDKDGTDASGAGRDAAANNGAAISRHTFQLGGGAASFDGQAAFYKIQAYSPVVQNDSRSVAFWVRGEAPSAAIPNKIFVGWGGVSSDPRVRFDIGLEQANDRRLRVEFNTDAEVTTASSVNFLDGAWHQVLVAYEGALMTFFVDGKPYSDAAPRLMPLQTDTSIAGTVIGAGVREAVGRLGDSKRFFAGQIDDFGVWDEALTATEAALLNGMGRIGDNDLRWLERARELWRSKTGSGIVINGKTWRKVGGLAGDIGDWVRAGGRDGAGSFIVLNHVGEGLQVSPRWWENTAARAVGLALLGLAGILLLAWSYDRMRIAVRLRRLESAQKAETERRRISQDLHDDLGAQLTEIILLGEKAQEGIDSTAELKHHIGTISQKARSLVTALDEVVWTVNPENDFLPDLADYLSDYAQEFLQNTSAHCRLDVARDLPRATLPAKVRRNILSAVKEALNNAVRHSNASEVWLRLRREGEVLEVVIEDNGQGMNIAECAGKGNGLRNMGERIKAIGGRLDLTSQTGEGTKIVFRLPLNEVQ